MSDQEKGFWDGAEIIHRYTRKQALADGMLVDVTEIAKEAGFKWPVALTRAAWNDCVAWTADDDKKQKTIQDEAGRLWDVVWMGLMGIRMASKKDGFLLYELVRVPRDGKTQTAKPTKLKLVAGPGDEAEPVITIMLPEED